jgi:predicted RNase H-like HicB family nuclease
MSKQKITTKNGVNALVWKEVDIFVAKAVEVELASQGNTQKQALNNLQEALELYFEDEKIPQEKISSLPSLKLHKLFPQIHYA